MPDDPDYDVLIIGAGITGIGAACELRASLPGKSFAILESRAAIGGTWDLFRYPGIRSDVDMYTFGYSFRPWRDPEAIAEGQAIREYLAATVDEFGVKDKIRFGHRVTGAEWSGADACWKVRGTHGIDDDPFELTARWIFSATGYFRYDSGHSPTFEGMEKFEGEVVHPQHWPEDLDHSDRRVVVVGSGATAVTLVPAMAATAAHVTMLQRSPTYIAAVPRQDPLVRLANKLLPPDRAYAFARRKSIFTQELVWRLSKSRPSIVRNWLLKAAARQLPEGYDVARHFTPAYNPWDQRICVVPGGDLFREIRRGRASVTTDRIARFTPSGILLESGTELPADVVVTATGLELLALGGIEFTVDGTIVDISEALTWRGMMLTGLPNLICSFPYPHVAWTLRVEVVAAFFARLLARMDESALTSCVPVNADPAVETRPFGDYTSNYVLRAQHLFPKSGDRDPWMMDLKLRRDARTLQSMPIDDGTLEFTGRQSGGAVASTP